MELKADQIPQDQLPHFSIPLRVEDVPPELVALPPDACVRFSKAIAGRTLEGVMTAGDLAELLAETASRQSDGWLTIEEAAQTLEDAGRGSVKAWCQKLAAAAQAGELPMHEPGSLARLTYQGQPPSQQHRPMRKVSDWARIDDLDRWLDANEAHLPFRFRGVAKTQAAKPKRVPAQRAYEQAILSTLRELGYDPKHLPKTPSGKGSPVKKPVQKALGYTDSVMKKAWQGLRDDKLIADD